ncbi:universal stress protein [Halobellus ruber]|uniref:Universal stress protein n=1 Tax=Halobellus ruber TaxID=2761102 RepID=A0A7J9SK56_9EURY|nr:universal stress protein [Halobellus ruber]MBB6647078.1 universal stress protein [Halobellus ruber]
MNVTHRILVPFELPDANEVPPVLVDTLATMEVVLLGHYGLPEQTPPSAARDQFEDDARAELDDIARRFEETGVSLTTRLVFGKAREKTINRVALEEDCDVILTPGDADAVTRVLVPLRGEANFDRILSFVGELLTATGASVTLFHTGEESDRLPGEEILADATDRLVEAGVDPDRISRQLSAEDDIERSIVDLGDTFDLLVLGETEPSLRDRIFGSRPAQVTAGTDDPAFVVRNVEQP